MENRIDIARSSLDFAALGELRSRAQRHEESALRDTAEQFEAMFLQMMLKTMRDATPKSGLFDSHAMDTYESMYDRELSLHMASRGSIGISDMLVKQLSRNKPMQSTADFLSNRQKQDGIKLPSRTKGTEFRILDDAARVFPLPDRGNKPFPLNAQGESISSEDTKSLEGVK